MKFISESKGYIQGTRNGVKGWWESSQPMFGNELFVVFIKYLVLACIVLITVSLLAMTLPFWLAILGFKYSTQNKWVLGLLSILSYGYIIVDIHKQWCSAILYYGWHPDENTTTAGMLGASSMEGLLWLSKMGLALGIAHIITSMISKHFSAILIEKSKTYHDLQWILAIVVYGIPVFIAYFFVDSIQV